MAPKFKIGDKVIINVIRSNFWEGVRAEIVGCPVAGITYLCKQLELNKPNYFNPVGHVQPVDDIYLTLDQQPHVAQGKIVTNDTITVKEAHAKPSLLNTPCCGWCGEPLMPVYEPRHGVRSNCCPTHGFGAPIVEVNTRTQRHPTP